MLFSFCYGKKTFPVCHSWEKSLSVRSARLLIYYSGYFLSKDIRKAISFPYEQESCKLFLLQYLKPVQERQENQVAHFKLQSAGSATGLS